MFRKYRTKRRYVRQILKNTTYARIGNKEIVGPADAVAAWKNLAVAAAKFVDGDDSGYREPKHKGLRNHRPVTDRQPGWTSERVYK